MTFKQYSKLGFKFILLFSTIIGIVFGISFGLEGLNLPNSYVVFFAFISILVTMISGGWVLYLILDSILNQIENIRREYEKSNSSNDSPVSTV